MILNIFRWINLITRKTFITSRRMPGVESDLLWSQTQNWATLLCLFWATLPHFQQIANHPIIMFVFLLVFHLHLIFAFEFWICLLHFEFGMIYLYCIWIWAILRDKREFTKKMHNIKYLNLNFNFDLYLYLYLYVGHFEGNKLASLKVVTSRLVSNYDPPSY